MTADHPLRSRLDDRGGVTLEYTILLCLVAVVCVLAIVSLGGPLVRGFVLRETWLLLPFP